MVLVVAVGVLGCDRRRLHQLSTFEGERSGWLRANLIERVKAATSKPVEHIAAEREQVKS